MNHDILNHEQVQAHLDSGVHLDAVFETVDSTNTYLKKLCNMQSIVDKTAVIAESQTDGRGRLGRSFCSAAGGVYLSVAFASRYDADTALFITAAAAVAVCRVLDLYTEEKAQIKWVNDVYLGGKKVCGILTEAVTNAQSGKIKNIIVGIGINLRGFEKFSPELKPIVTTLEEHAKVLPTRAALAAQIINALCRVSEGLTDVAIIDEYRARSFVIGKPVRVIQNGAERNALVTDIDAHGSLCVTYEGGEAARLSSAEISIRPNGNR